MDTLMQILPVVVYVLVIALLVVLIIIGLRIIKTLDNVNVLLQDAEKKLSSLNGLFDVIDSVTDSISLINDKIVDGITGFIAKLFKKKNIKKKKKEKEEEYDDEEEVIEYE